MSFRDRREAGQRLAERLTHLRGAPNVIVAALPRGGVPVGAEVAAALDVPLDVIVVRKLGVPGQPELAMGAIGEGGVRVLNSRVIELAGVSDRELAVVERAERAELERRADRFRGNGARRELRAKHVVIVDDGVATGSTAKAACDVARAQGASRIVLAVPVAPVGWTDQLAGAADDFVAVETPARFGSVGQAYRHFDQTPDDVVVALLVDAQRRIAPEPGG